MSSARPPIERPPIVLGVVTRPHGVRGEVRVHRFNPTSTLLLEVERVLVRKDGRTAERSVRASKRSGDADVLHLAGCDRVEDAEALRGAEIAVDRAVMPALGEGEVYHADLSGLRVREGERAIGEVLEVSALPSVDVLRVRTDRGTIEIPMLEPYLVAIDLDTGTIEVAHTDDLDAEP